MENVNKKMNKKSSKRLEQTSYDPNTLLYFQLILFNLVVLCLRSSVFRATETPFECGSAASGILCFVVVCIDYLLCQQFALIISEHAQQPLWNRDKNQSQAVNGSTHAIPSNEENHEPKWIFDKVFIYTAISSCFHFCRFFFYISGINICWWMHAKACSRFRIAKFI